LTNKAVIFDLQFREDLRWWFRKDKKVSERILNLIEATILNPFEGIGKPERLKYFSGSRWSRRITQEHRLVYQVSLDKLIFLQCRYHYE
jgi:toxin YoeB